MCSIKSSQIVRCPSIAVFPTNEIVTAFDRRVSGIFPKQVSSTALTLLLGMVCSEKCVAIDETGGTILKATVVVAI